MFKDNNCIYKNFFEIGSKLKVKILFFFVDFEHVPRTFFDIPIVYFEQKILGQKVETKYNGVVINLEVIVVFISIKMIRNHKVAWP